MTVRILPMKINHNTGYDVNITSENATVQEYLDALNDFIEDDSLTRLWEDRKDCCGCDLCCAERIPVTSVDVYRLSLTDYVKERCSPNHCDACRTEHNAYFLKDIVLRFLHVFVEQSVVDISLRLNEKGQCPFLNSEKRLCSIYSFRPFVCQTFICCPVSERAAKLRECIVNAGENELVRWWLHLVKEETMDVWFDEANAPEVNFNEWKKNAFTEKNSFSEILIKDIVPDTLWNTLFKN